MQSSTGVSGSGRKSSVHKTTKRFSDEMQSEFGYLNYKYNRSWPDYKKPSNITEIMTMLAKDRNDNPTVEDWDAYCDFANISLLELAIRSYTTEFLGFREIDGIDRSVPTAWTTAGLLPGKQLLMTPDFCCGIQSDALGILQRPWVNSVLPGFVTDESVLWVNGIIECKAPASSDMYQAVSLEQLASRVRPQNLSD